jgi:transposase
MLKISFGEADIEARRYGRFQPPDPRVHVRMEAVYLRRQTVANGDILRLCGLSKARCHRDLHAYVTGGLEQLKPFAPRRPRSALHHHRTTLEAAFQQRPPATVAAAAARIEALTGMVRRPPPVRQFWKALGRQPRQVGMIPAKADVAAQEAVKHTVWSPGSPRPRPASARSSAWRPPMVCWRPFGESSGAVNAGLSTRHQAANACMCSRPSPP